MKNSLRSWHGISALILFSFLIAHLANHLAGLKGVETHLRWMLQFRKLYRHPLGESILLLAVSFQIVSGSFFVIRGWKERRGWIPWLQAGAGAYLAFFFLNHVGAVLLGRHYLHLDTNFYFAAAGFFAPPFHYFFAPYYFFGVLALFVHLACALYWQFERRSQPARLTSFILITAVGFSISLLIVLTLAGSFYPVEIPPAYRATYGR